jgi:hypothetical protein
MDDLKEKTKHRTRQSPIDFVVPMQLEACVHVIEERKSRYPLYLNIPEHDRDGARFTGRLVASGEVVATARGTLRRWQGTSTRFQGTIDVLNDRIYQPQRRFLWVIPNMLWFISIFLAIGLSAMSVQLPLWFFMMFAPILLIGLNVLVYTTLNPMIARRHFTRLMKEALKSE